MHIIAIANQKGGVGKTTTAINLAAGICAATGKKPLLVDTDAQGNLTSACGLDPNEVDATVLDWMAGEATFEEVAQECKAFDVVPANRRLIGVDARFANTYGKEHLLAEALGHVEAFGYDFVLVDCPPGMGVVPINALVASTAVCAVVQTQYFALEGLALLEETLKKLYSQTRFKN